MTKQLLIIDNDDQSEAIDTINKLAKTKPFTINCNQFNVGLPDGNDVVDGNGRIDMKLVREKYEDQFGNRKFHLIAFDFKLNEESDTGVDGVTLIQQFNAIGKTRRAKKLLYSSELTEIVHEYLDSYKVHGDYEKSWMKFKTLINLEILDFCRREDYEKKLVSFIEKITDQDDDFIEEELRGNKDLFFNPSIETFEGSNFEAIADKIVDNDPEAIKFKRKLIQLGRAHVAVLKNG